MASSCELSGRQESCSSRAQEPSSPHQASNCSHEERRSLARAAERESGVPVITSSSSSQPATSPASPTTTRPGGNSGEAERSQAATVKATTRRAVAERKSRNRRRLDLKKVVTAREILASQVPAEIPTALETLSRSAGQSLPGHHDQTRERQRDVGFDLRIGRRRIRLPVAAKMALVSAGAAGGSGGSPIPAGGLSVGRMWTSISGDSAIESNL